MGVSDDARIAKQLEGAEIRDGVCSVRPAIARRRLLSAMNIVLGLCLFLLIWSAFAVAYNGGSSTLAFPSPIETVNRLGAYFFDGQLLYGHTIWEHIGASMLRLLAAFSLATVVGVSIGCLIGYFSKIYVIGMVPVSIFQMIPGLAWLPIAILLFGLGDESAVFIIFAVTSMVIAVGVSGGIRMVPSVLVRAAKMMGAGGFCIFFKVLIPQAAATIIGSLRLGMASSMRVLIASEMVVGTGLGIGYSIELTRDLLDYTGSFACIAVICLLGLFIDRLVLANLERFVRRRLGMGE